MNKEIFYHNILRIVKGSLAGRHCTCMINIQDDHIEEEYICYVIVKLACDGYMVFHEKNWVRGEVIRVGRR